MYCLVYRKQASKALARMPKAAGKRFIMAFERLAADPFDAGHYDVIKLSGRAGYRLRIGNWRALYCIHEEKLMLEVLRVDTRGDIYK